MVINILLALVVFIILTRSYYIYRDFSDRRQYRQQLLDQQNDLAAQMMELKQKMAMSDVEFNRDMRNMVDTHERMLVELATQITGEVGETATKKTGNSDTPAPSLEGSETSDDSPQA